MDVIPAISTRGAQNAPPPSYQAYLNSPHWRMTRNDALKRAGYRCSRCPSKRDLQVHHRTYQRLGAEWAGDLEVLCFRCHNGHHQDEATQSGTQLGLLLKVVSSVLQRNAWARIPDIAEDAKRLCADKGINYDPYVLHKAVEMACGTRQKDYDSRGRERHYVSVVESDDDEMTDAQAKEFLIRLKGACGISLDDIVRRMPEAYGTNRPDHEQKVRDQAALMRGEFMQQRRRPLRERLEAIFSEKP